MLELEVVLDFACCHCDQQLGVTLKCEGEGLADKDASAAFPMTCPFCNQKNDVVFVPDTSEVLYVWPDLETVRFMIPEPSLN